VRISGAQGGARADECAPEFRRHRAADSPAHIIGFLSQWKRYLDQLPASPDAGGAFRGARMDPTVFEKVRACLPRACAAAC
jgi:hypothetical protein